MEVFFVTTMNYVKVFLKGTKEKSLLGLTLAEKLLDFFYFVTTLLIWAGLTFWYSYFWLLPYLFFKNLSSQRSVCVCLILACF